MRGSRIADGALVALAPLAPLAEQGHDLAIADRQIAEGAGVVFDVAGGGGPGTVAAARGAGVWAIGADRDRAGWGPFLLTSVLKRYGRAFAILVRQARSHRVPAGREVVPGLPRGGTEFRPAIVRGTIRVPGAP